MQTSHLLAFILFTSLAADAADIHVSPTGDDIAGTGAALKPFATLVRARDEARKTAGQNTVLLAPGRYFNDAPIVLDDRDSGLTLKGAAPGAVAEIYGGVPVTGWEKWKGDIWRARVPKDKRFFNLIVDGKPATMAQSPKRGSGFAGEFSAHGNAAIRVAEKYRECDFSDAQVFAWIGGNWFSEMRAPTVDKPNKEGILPVDSGNGGQFGGMNWRIQVRGLLELLTEPGEWCVKHKEGYVYWWPMGGKPDDYLVVRPAGEKLLDVHGRSPATPVKNIRFENLSIIGSDFCHRWYLFENNQHGSTPAPLQQGMVFGQNVDGLHISACRLLAAGHSAVWFNHHALNGVVENCLIQGAGFAGIYANGFKPGEGNFKSADESYVNKGHRIENNFIHDCGKYVGGGCGIQFYQSGDIYGMTRGSWAKYANVDFGSKSPTKAVFQLTAKKPDPMAGKPFVRQYGDLIELRLKSPEGNCIGTLMAGATECPIQPISGIHTVYLVFPGDSIQTVDWFKFE